MLIRVLFALLVTLDSDKDTHCAEMLVLAPNKK